MIHNQLDAGAFASTNWQISNRQSSFIQQVFAILGDFASWGWGADMQSKVAQKKREPSITESILVMHHAQFMQLYSEGVFSWSSRYPAKTKAGTLFHRNLWFVYCLFFLKRWNWSNIYKLVGGFIFLIFQNIWDNPFHWLMFFKMVKTTNQ